MPSLILTAIKLYQHTLSPDHGPARFLFPYGVCKYQLTCSQYTYHAVRRHGWRGLLIGLKRVATCL